MGKSDWSGPDSTTPDDCKGQNATAIKYTYKDASCGGATTCDETAQGMSLKLTMAGVDQQGCSDTEAPSESCTKSIIDNYVNGFCVELTPSTTQVVKELPKFVAESLQHRVVTV